MRTRWLFSLMGALALLFLLSGSPPAGAASLYADPFPIQTGYDCTGGGNGSPGVAAIQPHLHAIPSFTADDVRQNLKANGMPGWSQFTIVKILFITGQEVCERTRGESTGLDDNAPVCFVELRGEFWPISYPYGVHPQPSPYAYEVFDAQTGNLLVFSD